MATVRDVGGFRAVRGKPVVGFLPEAAVDGPGLMLRMMMEHGDRVLMRFAQVEYRTISDPEDIRHVLVTNAASYVKSPTYDGLKLIVGEGLVTSDGELWKRQRRLMQSAFQPRRIESFVPMMQQCVDAMLDGWAAAGDGAVLDVHQEMMRVTLRIIGKAIASVDLADEADVLGEAVAGVLRFADQYFGEIIKLPLWLPLPMHRRFQRDLARLDALVQRLVDDHRGLAARGDAPNDLLTALITATDQEVMSDRQLRDELLTLLVAGHETTANALTWTAYLLSRHPDVARAVRAEVAEVVGERPLSVDALAQLELTERVLKESMRLYPPAWIVERAGLSDDVLPSGATLPAKKIVAVCTYAVHRSPRLWDDPEAFDPDRFTAARAAGRHKFAYLPFGAGPRVCLGAHFAMLEAKLVLAAVARRWHLELVPGHRVELEPGVTLRSKHGMRMRLRGTR